MKNNLDQIALKADNIPPEGFDKLEDIMPSVKLPGGATYHTGRISKAAELSLYGKGDGPMLMTRRPLFQPREMEPEQAEQPQTSEPSEGD